MKNICFLILLSFPAFISIFCAGTQWAYAQEDDNADDTMVDSEETNILVEDELEEEFSTSSVDADTTILFIKPVVTNALSNLELPGGHLVEFLVGFTNKGKTDFILDTLETSLRYPMDFKFYIQNFTTLSVEKVVKPNHEATIAYSFIPSETFAGRPFGLNVNLNYRDMNGAYFNEAIYNETVQIVELDEGLDGETVFLYIFLVACVILTLVGGQQLLSSFGKRSRSPRKQTIEVGTSNPNNVDYDWLPKETLNRLNKSPRTPKQSPKQRKVRRMAGSDD
ncbi:translocon-associated protein subunit alpha [Microplitis mediator]|uniref:translocon-associated protein subunit alpha n=1 Tax=Microplitis mediator TaxID=375433 RepID=UPI002556DC86|nr:translocon-associated protein subunit alpha [Microplitis mediator]